MRFAFSIVLAGCAGETSREARIVHALAEDNYVWSRREPELVRMKLRKMQRGPYEWLRGTAALSWRDATEPGGARASTTFGNPASSRVLLLGDPHVENAGTFRAGDGTMFVDWNDFDATGYGPFVADVRRLAASFAIVAELAASGDTELAMETTRVIATRYAETIGLVASGTRVGAIGSGQHPLLDDELVKSGTRGDARFALDEVAPIVGGVRVVAFGDLEAVAEDGVIEDRLVEVTAEQAHWIDRAIAAWRIGKLDATSAAVVHRMRRIGPGISSYAAYRFDVVLAGPTSSPDDDILVELKETREGVIVPDVPRLGAAEWPSPAARAVDAQKRLHARADGDALLGHAELGGLSLKVRDREAYQRGVDAPDVAELSRDSIRDLAGIYGTMLARAHGQASTEDGLPGHAVIAPLLTGREAAFADEIVRLAVDDAAQIRADFVLFEDRDLASLVIGEPR